MTTAAILGAGQVGRALAERCLSASVDVRFGSRDPAAAAGKLTGAVASIPIRHPATAAAEAELLLLAVPAAAAVNALRSAGALDGKIVVDCTNPIRWDGGPVWAPPAEGSVSQSLAAAFPGIQVIKGFNHFGAEIIRNPALVTGPVDAFFAGDAPEAKSLVMSMAVRMGFGAHDAGPLRNAALLESFAVLWIQVATSRATGRDLGFRVESRP